MSTNNNYSLTNILAGRYSRLVLAYHRNIGVGVYMLSDMCLYE